MQEVSGKNLHCVSNLNPDDLGVDRTNSLVQDFTAGFLYQFD